MGRCGYTSAEHALVYIPRDREFSGQACFGRMVSIDGVRGIVLIIGSSVYTLVNAKEIPMPESLKEHFMHWALSNIS